MFHPEFHKVPFFTGLVLVMLLTALVLAEWAGTWDPHPAPVDVNPQSIHLEVDNTCHGWIIWLGWENLPAGDKVIGHYYVGLDQPVAFTLTTTGSGRQIVALGFEPEPNITVAAGFFDTTDTQRGIAVADSMPLPTC
jgi:hypothetical protein